MKAQYYKLDPSAILRMIREQSLKKYWVAEVAGVHKTTLRRWLSGKILRIREDRLLQLAQVIAARPVQIAQNYPQ